jgi:hypothetical protein
VYRYRIHAEADFSRWHVVGDASANRSSFGNQYDATLDLMDIWQGGHSQDSSGLSEISGTVK